jgi:hypothetical protein
MIYLEDYTTYRSNINDDEVYNDLKNYLETNKPKHGEHWGVFGRRHFEFAGFKVYIRINIRILEGKQYTVLEIADIDARDKEDNKGNYTKFIQWCLENSIFSIFIETGEYDVFKIFGQYIKSSGEPNTFNMLTRLGFKPYEKDSSMFYYIKQ